MIAEVHREGKIHRQEYEKGIATTEVRVAGKTKKPVVPKPPKAAAPAVKTFSKEFYTVKEGDTLADIAKNLLGSTKYKNRFYAVNKALDLEFTGDLIYTGMRLRVPKL